MQSSIGTAYPTNELVDRPYMSVVTGDWLAYKGHIVTVDH